MQRVLLNAGRLGAGATAGIASTSHCRADQAAPSAVTYHEEGDWGFVNLQKHEVTGVLRDLCKASKTSPVITEVDESGSDISTGAEELFARAEDLGAASNLDTLGDIVTNLLSDEIAGPAIHGALMRDPAFLGLVAEYNGYALPAAATPLMLPAPIGTRTPVARGASPLDALMNGIAELFTKIGEACVVFGGALRRLPEDLAILLGGMRPEPAVHRHGARAEGAQAWEAALKRVVMAVAMVFIVRRACRLA